ncbi:universal stress protein [Mycolicibacterium litorale]|uniref:universal stress protein n=1 Tax=Mycolicibacterium litorale TaxID=758802 RepID=UPI003CE6869B
MAVAAAMPTHVLVATDLSEPAAMAVTRAAQLADQHGAELTVLHVLEGQTRTDLADSARSAVHSHVTESVGDRTRADSASPRVAIRRGRPAVEIASEAVESAADLVVVGAGGPRSLTEAFLGSTAENVVRMSPAPVLIAKRGAADPYRKVILAVDTTAESADAARLGSRVTPDAQHSVVHACTVVGEGLMRAYGVADDQLEELRHVETEEARDFVARLSATLSPRPREVLVTPGHPPTRLAELSQSRSVDLIVVGTGARSPLSYAFLGSVAQHVMRESRADVLVVPANLADTPR